MSRQFALNIGIRFVTPEVLWFDQPDTEKFEMPKFNPTELLWSTDLEANSKLPLIEKPNQLELILMVGYPACKLFFSVRQLMMIGVGCELQSIVL
ncbi:unnamed protein product [Trichobilharzia regenti]|nr:unnamed protein product [Trichobilharzia regenti]